MAGGSGLTQKGMVLFLVGIVLGFLLTFLFTQQTHHTAYVPHGQGGAFIPNSPHSHGEMDSFKGPDESVDWSEAHFHSHAGEIKRKMLIRALKLNLRT